MKVLCCSHSSYLGGAELAFVEMIKYMNADIFVSVPDLNGPIVSKIKQLGKGTIIQNKWHAWMSIDDYSFIKRIKVFTHIIFEIKQCRKLIREIKADKVLVNSIVCPVAMIAAWSLNIPSIICVHENGGFGEYKLLFGDRITKSLIGRFATNIVCNSYYIRNEYGKYICSNKLTVKYQPVEIKPKGHQCTAVFTVGMVGLLSKQKNHILLFDAIKDFHDIYVLLAGNDNTDYSTELKSYCNKIGLGKRVNFLGTVEDMADFYSRIDVLVACGQQEALGRSVVEAMKCRVLVVAMRDGGYIELVGENNERGLLFECNRIEDLQAKLMIARKYKFQDKIDAAEDFVLRNFSGDGYKCFFE